MGDLALFLASDPADGFEPWVSDGTAAGTRLLIDLCPGSCSADFTPLWRTGTRRAFAQGGALWSTDGTPAGTIRLPGLAPPFASGSSEPTILGVLSGPERRIYRGRFPGSAVDSGLWASDGTVAGTRPFFNLGHFDVDVRPGVGLGDLVLFVRDVHDLGGIELWRTDGTADGTGLVADILPGMTSGGSPASSSPDHFVALDSGIALFAATGPTAGRELWASDGSAGGTARLADLTPGPGASRFVTDPVADGGRALFVVEPFPEGPQQLWVSDGTASGTRALTAFGSPSAFGEPTDLIRRPVSEILQVVGDTIYFVADDGVSGLEPWVSDGTPLGTHRLADVCPGSCSSSPRLADEHPAGVAAFVADDGVSGAEPWVTDGTVAGTRRLVDACPGACGSSAIGFKADGARVFFDALAEGGGSHQLWVSDGSPSGTRSLTAFASGEPGLQGAADDRGVAGGRLLFVAYDAEHGTELWASDGTVAGTGPLGDFATQSTRDANPRELLRAGLHAFFSADDAVSPGGLWVSAGGAAGAGPVRELASGIQEPPGALVVATIGSRALFISADAHLWVSDGTPAGTQPLAGLPASGDGERSAPRFGADDLRGSPPGDPGATAPRGHFGDLGGAAVFFLYGELWASDGTPEGTGPIADLQPVVGAPVGPFFATLGNRVVVSARSAGRGIPASLWITDGTTAGTRLITSGEGEDTFLPQQLTAAAGRVFFGTRGGGGGFELWTTDGTTEGTGVLPAPLFDPRDLTAVGARLFFTASSSLGSRELWVSDGTAAGTRIAGPVPREGAPAILRESEAFGDRLAFVPSDGVLGQELWVSDGTPEGTHRVIDLWPGRGSAEVADLVAVGDRLVFTASTPERGRELWETDGTDDGTSPVTDLVAGPGSSSPSGTTLVGTNLLFAATDGVVGRELWALDLDGGAGGGEGPPPPPGPWLTSPDLPGFRVKVRITPQGGAPLLGSAEPVCIPETLCVSGALAGRSEVFVRVVGPKPNGRLWPTLVKFSTSEVEVWIEQLSTGEVEYYLLEGARPGFDELPGLFDREGFEP